MAVIEWDEEMKEAIIERMKQWEKGKEPILVWVMELEKYLLNCSTSVADLPSAELGELLVSHLCFENNHPSIWKFIDQALLSSSSRSHHRLRLLCPLQILSLLCCRIIPHRRSQPEAYALFLQLLARYTFSFDPTASLSSISEQKILNSVDAALQLSQTYKLNFLELGHVFVLFLYSVIIALIDSTLDDWGFQMAFLEKPCSVPKDNQYMEICSKVTQNSERSKYHEQLRKRNSLMALEILERLTKSQKAMVLLQSVLLNMPEKFNCLLQRLQFLESLELTSSGLKVAKQVLTNVVANIHKVSHFEYHLHKHQHNGILAHVGSCEAMLRHKHRSCQSSIWVPFDIYMENAMDAKQLPTKSAIDVITQAIKTLQIFYQASWQETFLALWLSALRLVERECDPIEGPIPRLEARLSVLLSIVPLAIANILQDESEHNSPSVQASMECEMEKDDCSKKLGLISSVQILGNFSSLLLPPALVVDAANHAAKKAACFIYNSRNKEGDSGNDFYAQTCTKSGGSLWHLIVEACIARNLIDSSVYFWPGYVSTSAISSSEASMIEESPWSTFMEGVPLDNSLINSLSLTPASSLAEIEKLFHIAVNGLEKERPAAAKILCGASLSRGWYIQEHVVHHVVKLLALPIPSCHSGSWGHLINNMPVISAILSGASSVDTVHILSLHGVVPTLAASLLPLCEAFGSLKPTLDSRGDEPSVYMVFSLAFLLLNRLWKFYRAPLDQCITEGGGAIGGLEYLLSLHNSLILSSQNEMKTNQSTFEPLFDKPVCIDSFPKLQAWYCQYKFCATSAISGLSTGNSVHQVTDKILSMIYRKMTKSVTSPSNSSSLTSSNACGSLMKACEDVYQRPVLPAWEVLEALPFVLEAVLTACAHGKLSSRDLTTGLRDLVDFLPASLAVITGYFSSEVTRGVWKQVPMNGMDWPSPAAILQSVESEIKAILAAVGVDIPNCSTGNSPVMLPLPMAALVSLTITFKLDKSLEYIHAIAGPALENCASACPWPTMPVISSLWAQKARRWHNFIIYSCSRSVFRHDKESIAQLLRSCFSSFLGTLGVSVTKLTAESSVNGLLGSTITAPVAPGFIYLRSFRNIHDIRCLNTAIVGLVAEYARTLPGRWASADSLSNRVKSSESSLSLATQRAKEVASLGASLLPVAGGIQLIQELYRETIPTWLLSSRDGKLNNESAASHILEGFAMAYLLMLSGSIMWGVGANLPSGVSSRRSHTIGVHLDLLAEVMEGNISLGCNFTTWKTYVCCLVGLMVSLAPAWIQDVKVDTMRKLAYGLCRLHEHELAISLLQRGGTAAMGALAELVNMIY